MNPALKRQFEAATAVDEKIEKKQKQSRDREIGTVLDYDKAKGFGFLLDADEEKLFVHQSQIVSPGFRMLTAGQKVSYVRGMNRDKPWAEDVRNPDGSPVMQDKAEESSGLANKKRKQQLKEQWRNFFEIPQYALKGHGESLPTTVANQDAFVMGETVPQLGKIFVMAHGCAATTGKGNECATYMKEKLPKYIAKAYEDNPNAAEALKTAFETTEAEWMERAKMKSLTDGAEVTAALFVHALNSSGQPCVQLWLASTGASVAVLCSHEGVAQRVLEPHSTKKAVDALKEAGFYVTDAGKADVAFAEVGQNKPSTLFRLPAMRLIGGRPFKSARSPVTAKVEVKKVREWRCVAGEEPFLVMFSAEVASVLKDQDVVNVSLDAWGSGAEDLDGWVAASKAVIRTAQAQGPDRDSLASMAVQCWWQEKPLQRLLARRADKKGTGAAVAAKPADDGFDMFG
mmetsp:Transcript_4385/g.7779  ORF Transcript_4385/g.7779 Transcript_4385/m.7779 type:complete len:457 (+) Transcript_4385:43-1413(+)|eukprot:CAMPEP_0197626412 /NCGR_PEP_ID=MMETSP1338-20131121/5393_1 /TAXON_ID=43686 ORGANISM="Pelagodinium beii, Strain RCC1491" /NCGR_SAMPLE_ID=MMETSP1338 /ASSEMBLY_ACC=CAM_ASM_000754 /LENGTH=456 /DNA_ID=CAMNT_0043196953 /DNA_START=38 /DNA_END=1408 /DNA_ORIENTATION=+